MVAASIGAKAAVLIVLTVALVALVGSLTVNAIAGPSALEQRFTPRQLGLRTALMRKQRATQLWAVQDNGVSTTINTRGFANGDGGISYGSNFVYGSTGTPVVQANDVSDQWWRYGNEGNYFMTGPSSGGYTPNYELINVGPYQSDGSDWGYELEPATPTYNYFPKQNYPGSSAYNYPASVMSPEQGKDAWIVTNGDSQVDWNGRVHSDHPDNSMRDVHYNPEW